MGLIFCLPLSLMETFPNNPHSTMTTAKKISHAWHCTIQSATPMDLDCFQSKSETPNISLFGFTQNESLQGLDECRTAHLH